MLDLFDTAAGEALKVKAAEGRQQPFSFSKECMADYMAVHTHAHKADEPTTTTFINSMTATNATGGPRKMIGLQTAASFK